MRQYIKKYLLIFFGSLFVMLGIIGAVLPLLPTTPFLILALACFAKSSPRFHRLLLKNRWFGPALQQWEESRSITHKAKNRAMVLIVITFSISIALLYGRTLLQLMLLCMACVLLFFMRRLKEREVE